MDSQRFLDTTRLLACTSYLLIHRTLLNRGFVLQRRGLSTDTSASLLLGLATSLWSAATLWHISSLPVPTLVRLALLTRGPLLAQIVFLFWLTSWADALIASRTHSVPPRLWPLSTLNGPFDWAGAHRGFYLAIAACLSIVIGPPALAALAVGDYISGVLNLLSAVLFLLEGTGRNPYGSTAHRHADSSLRIALPTSHHEGTLYVLPGSGFGIDAIWSPKVAAEHAEADSEMMALFRHMRSGRWALSEPLERLRSTLAHYQQRVVISSAQVVDLASWIYLDRTPSNAWVREIACQRAAGVHLIGRDLMYALCHAEYLVFMGQARLPRHLQEKLGTVRLMNRSGAGAGEREDVKTVGFKAGVEGYREAVEYVYAIFDTDVDAAALSFAGTTAPLYSVALGKRPAGIEEYVAELWDVSCAHSESVFTALYMFTTVWFVELGNVNGFHIFPLRCRSRDGDLVSQQIMWRQVWFSALIAQLVATSPAMFGLFVLGYVQ
ncbi:MAG: hypothetical protein M1829_002118 [Trizodia sp. TS-e1964]|nr:MAG: hypothetical protein M1829_002118 [Trizodia sp. TS-e1964]